MEKTTLYLPEALHQALRAEARRTGRSQAELVRDALAAYLESTPRPRPRSIGVALDSEVRATEIEDRLDLEWGRR